MSPTNKILVFAKAPRPGFAKTRLIPLLGAEGAAALHARLIKHTLQTVKRAAVGVIELHGTPADDDFLRYCADRYDAQLLEQSAGDLGARMCAALRDALNSCTGAILVGTDCAALTVRQVRRAARALGDGSDAVFVPTEDGGYALIGLARCDAGLFEGIAWSTPAVMDETRTRLRDLGWRWHELDTVWDVDYPADYERLCESRLLERPSRRMDVR